MPSKKKPAPDLPAIPQERIDQFVTGPISPGLSTRSAKPEQAGNHRNGRSAKTVLAENGPAHRSAARPSRLLRADPHPPSREDLVALQQCSNPRTADSSASRGYPAFDRPL